MCSTYKMCFSVFQRKFLFNRDLVAKNCDLRLEGTRCKVFCDVGMQSAGKSLWCMVKVV